MPPKAPADGLSAAPPKRTRKAATTAPAAPATAEKPAADPAGAPAADATPQRRIGGGWLAVGVGSAALVAALLFATRGKRNDWSK